MAFPPSLVLGGTGRGHAPGLLGGHRYRCFSRPRPRPLSRGGMVDSDGAEVLQRAVCVPGHRALLLAERGLLLQLETARRVASDRRRSTSHLVAAQSRAHARINNTTQRTHLPSSAAQSPVNKSQVVTARASAFSVHLSQ